MKPLSPAEVALLSEMAQGFTGRNATVAEVVVLHDVAELGWVSVYAAYRRREHRITDRGRLALRVHAAWVGSLS